MEKSLQETGSNPVSATKDVKRSREISEFADSSGNMTHYLGNDDFIDTEEQNEQFDGKVAQGNDLPEENEQFNNLEKRHSGL